VLVSENRALEMEFEPETARDQTGTVYIGKVRNVMKNLNAAFVEYRPGINGYYSLKENPVHLFADGREGTAPIKSGDEILVQVSRAAVKTKDAVLSSDITLTGRLSVVSSRAGKFGISSKIKDKKWREEMKAFWDANKIPGCGLVVRTNAYGVPFETIREEAALLAGRLEKIKSDALCRTCHSVLYHGESFAVRTAFDADASTTEEIVTDIPAVYEELLETGLFQTLGQSAAASRREPAPGQAASAEAPAPGAPALRLYTDDSYPMTALYHLESHLDRALSKTVWLKSGGYLVIEPTEAMTVIDVNTGKNVAKKSAGETYLRTNLEAAAEIALQLRLRNLSGIIIVDFIDMDTEEDNSALLKTLKKHLSADPVKTTLVDMTSLGLVEITRKKISRPLHEQV